MVELIIGQGVSGTLLSFFLSQSGIDHQVIDLQDPSTPSRVAAGIINPITGRNLKRSWQIDLLLPFAQQTYKSLSDFLGEPILDELGIRVLHHSQEEKDLWKERANDPDYARYLTGFYPAKELPGLNDDLGSVLVQPGLRVRWPSLLQAYRDFLVSEKRLISEEVFRYDELELSEGHCRYRGKTYNHVIFCEGPGIRNNPYFSDYPYRLNKGQALNIRVPYTSRHSATAIPHIIRKQGLMVPLAGNDQKDEYWIGASNEWHKDDVIPSEQARERLESKAKGVFSDEFEILDHRAALRCTMKDRRPLLGFHPEHKQLAVFNGLGGKGSSLGPWYAKQMAEALIQNSIEGIAEPVRLSRFS